MEVISKSNQPNYFPIRPRAELLLKLLDRKPTDLLILFRSFLLDDSTSSSSGISGTAMSPSKAKSPSDSVFTSTRSQTKPVFGLDSSSIPQSNVSSSFAILSSKGYGSSFLQFSGFEKPHSSRKSSVPKKNTSPRKM